MKVEYAPSVDIDDLREIVRFHDKYVKPFGRGRKSVLTSGTAVFIRADHPGLLTLTARFVELASGRLEDLTLEQVVSWEPPGGWFGDLEPGSPPFYIRRDGLARHSGRAFSYEPPPFETGHVPPFEGQFGLELVEYEPGRYHVSLQADAFALASLARHCIYLAQPGVPSGEQIRYNESLGLRTNSPRLILERSSFPEDVAWARIKN